MDKPKRTLPHYKKVTKKSIKKLRADLDLKDLTVKDLLIAGPRFEIPLPKRTRWRRRPPVKFD